MIGRLLGELVAAGAAVILLYFLFQLGTNVIKKITQDKRDY